MRDVTDRDKLENFLRELGIGVTGPGRVYLTGGATALLHGWRAMTIDVDLKALPEPRGLFQSIAPSLLRYPAIDPVGFRDRVANFCHP